MQEKSRNNGLEGYRITKHIVFQVFVRRAKFVELNTVRFESDYDGDYDDDDNNNNNI
jgi:hypothetical protein